jgi:hypothetical protein
MSALLAGTYAARVRSPAIVLATGMSPRSQCPSVWGDLDERKLRSHWGGASGTVWRAAGLVVVLGSLIGHARDWSCC